MVRAYLPAVVVACVAFAGAAAAHQPRPLVPAGGIWQSIPLKAEFEESVDGPKASITTSRKASSAKLRPARKAAKAAATTSRKPRPRRHPVAAADVAKPAPRATAAARKKELGRRIGVLLPGAKLGQAIRDPENPSWRRPIPGRPGAESRSLSLPFDDSGKSGFIARGYHADPDVQNPNGNTGATFGVRTKF